MLSVLVRRNTFVEYAKIETMTLFSNIFVCHFPWLAYYQHSEQDLNERLHVDFSYKAENL